MLSSKGTLIGNISSDNKMEGKLNNAIEEVFPELEDLVIIPKGEEQHFKSEKYGYDNVTVNAVNLQEKQITPTKETQEVLSDAEYSGLSKVTIAGDEDLVSENIKQGVNIFGVEGNFQGDTTYNASISTEKDNNTTFEINRYIKEIPLIDTSNITNMSEAFSSCINIESIPQLDTSNAINMSNAFNYCEKIKSIPLLNTSKVTNMTRLFAFCSSLETVPEIDTSSVTNMSYMFNYCEKLKSIFTLNASKVTNLSNIFNGCVSLQNIGGLENLGESYSRTQENYSSYTLDLSDCNNLTVESLMNIINNLYDLNLTYDVAGGGTLYRQKLTLGETNRAKLTDEQIAIATNKGWNVE